MLIAFSQLLIEILNHFLVHPILVLIRLYLQIEIVDVMIFPAKDQLHFRKLSLKLCQLSAVAAVGLLQVV